MAASIKEVKTQEQIHNWGVRQGDIAFGWLILDWAAAVNFLFCAIPFDTRYACTPVRKVCGAGKVMIKIRRASSSQSEGTLSLLYCPVGLRPGAGRMLNRPGLCDMLSLLADSWQKIGEGWAGRGMRNAAIHSSLPSTAFMFHCNTDAPETQRLLCTLAAGEGPAPDPMAISTYQQIEAHMRSAADEEGDVEYTDGELWLRQDLTLQKTCWSGEYSRDLWRLFCNSHPVVAIWGAHPLNPMAHWERLLVLLFSALLALYVSCAIAEAKSCLAHGYITCAPDAALGPSTAAGGDGQFLSCCNTYRFGLLWSLRHLDFGLGLGGPAYATAVNLPLGLLLFFAMQCGCVQFARSRTRRFFERLGHAVFACIAAWLVRHLPAYLRYTTAEHGARGLL